MKRNGFSTGMKAVAIMLQELFTVLLVVCIILISTMFERSMLDIGDFGNKDFTESGYYEDLFQSAVDEVLLYIDYQEQFETDGVFNTEKIINIMAYVERANYTSNIKTPLSNGEHFRYYLSDLEKWSKEYVQLESQVESQLYLDSEGKLRQYQQIIIDGEQIREVDNEISALKDMDTSLQEKVISDAEYYYSVFYFRINSEGIGGGDTDDAGDAGAISDARLKEIRKKVNDGKIYELNEEEIIIILKDLELLEKVVTTEDIVLEEKYMTVGGTTVLNEFLNERLTLREMQQAYDSLEYTLKNIGREITAYKRMVNKYEKGDSNLQFWASSKNQNQYYTNITEPVGRENLLDYGKMLGSYFYYNDNTITLDTNVEGMEDAFYDSLEMQNNGKNNVIFVGIDESFPYEDSFLKAKVEYNQLQPWVIVSLVGTVVSVLGCFLSFVYLSIAAGRNPEDTEIHLSWMDKIKTEILITAFLGVCIGFLFLIRELVSFLGDSGIISTMVMAGGLTVAGVALFMVFYLSFIRRIKVGIMWSGSLCCWIGRGIYMVFKNRRPSVKVLLLFGGHVVLTLILGGAAFILVRQRREELLIPVLLLYLLLCGAEAVFFLREGIQRNVIINGIKRVASGDLEYEIDTKVLKGDNKVMGEAINTIGEGLYSAVDDSVKNERLKTDLITNVSHDIKTPLTSIINYVDLLKREKLENERAQSYIRVLDAKSQRLKQLTEDLVEASKVSSGNINLQMERLNFVELVYQTGGEFDEKFEARGLTAITCMPKEPVIILADGRRIWRVIENLYNNVAKYALENTRVYVDMEVTGAEVSLSIKNISAQALNIQASELTERFIRGDVSRSTEGSGLGLSIAQNLTQIMGGTFNIYLDGDLFKVTITFPVIKEIKE